MWSILCGRSIQSVESIRIYMPSRHLWCLNARPGTVTATWCGYTGDHTEASRQRKQTSENNHQGACPLEIEAGDHIIALIIMWPLTCGHVYPPTYKDPRLGQLLPVSTGAISWDPYQQRGSSHPWTDSEGIWQPHRISSTSREGAGTATATLHAGDLCSRDEGGSSGWRKTSA